MNIVPCRLVTSTFYPADTDCSATIGGTSSNDWAICDQHREKHWYRSKMCIRDRTSFEQIVKEFKLSPDQYIRSTRLREWARRNKNSKYIPEALLEAWGFEIESTL